MFGISYLMRNKASHTTIESKIDPQEIINGQGIEELPIKIPLDIKRDFS